jgi:type IV secretion system protein VirD4
MTIWNGVPLGFDAKGKPIAYNKSADGSGNAPTLIFGPPGSKKTVGLICTELLDEPGKRSYIVIDPKGEIAAITAKYRRKVCGADNVKIVNAYGLLVKERPDLKSDQWNPLNDLEPGNRLSFADDAQSRGDALIKTSSHDSNPFFPDAARSGVTAAVMYEVHEADAQTLPRSLPNVRRVLTQEPEKLKASIKKMVDCGDYDISTRAAKLAADNREVEAIKSTIEVNTQWMTPALRDDMATAGGVDFRECRKRSTTIYIIVPTTELQSKAVYLRLALSSALRALYASPEGIPTTIIIEEGFVIGHHAEIEQALSILRGFNSRITVVFQSYSQIKKLYPETHGLFTAGAVLAFRPADLDTAEMLVKKAGRVTLAVHSSTEPKPGELIPGGGWQQHDRDRIPLDKMFGMPQGRALVWLPHADKPGIATVRGYFEIPRLARRASPNPYFAGGKRRPGRKVTGAIVAGLVAVVIAGAALFNVSGGVARPSWISGASPVVREDPPKANPPARGSSQSGKPQQHVTRR